MRRITHVTSLAAALLITAPGCTTTTVTVDGQQASVIVEAPGFYDSAKILTQAISATTTACTVVRRQPPAINPNPASIPPLSDTADAILKFGNVIHAAAKGWFGKTTITLTASCQ